MIGEGEASSTRILAVHGLRKSYGSLVAVDDVTLEVPANRVTGLIGPNGAGKSTLLAMLAGATRPSAGSIYLADQDVTAFSAYEMARRGVIRTFQSGGEFARLTCLENLLVATPSQRGESFWRFVGGWRRDEARSIARARELLRRFQLQDKENAYAGELSGGQRRLLELARALMAEPRVLLLDEPMAGVNPSLARDLGAYLLELKKDLSIVLVEHELDLVERVCDQIFVLAQGKVLASGTMQDLRENEEVVDAYLSG